MSGIQVLSAKEYVCPTLEDVIARMEVYKDRLASFRPYFPATLYLPEEGVAGQGMVISSNIYAQPRRDDILKWLTLTHTSLGSADRFVELYLRDYEKFLDTYKHEWIGFNEGITPAVQQKVYTCAYRKSSNEIVLEMRVEDTCKYALQNKAKVKKGNDAYSGDYTEISSPSQEDTRIICD